MFNDINEFIQYYDFLYSKDNNISKDYDSIKDKKHLANLRVEHSKLAESYLIEYISKMDPITFLTNIGLLSIGESLNLINYELRIQQYQIDFAMGLVLKYGIITIPSLYIPSGVDEVSKILKLISIYNFTTTHELHEKNLTADRISSYYRNCRLIGFGNQKLSIINELFNKYDEKTKSNNIKISKVINFLFEVDKIIVARLEAISGHIASIEEQYKFFMFFPDDIKQICYKLNIDYYKTIDMIMHFCIKIGDFKNVDVKEIYLNNPVHNKFIILGEPGYLFFPNISVVSENLIEVCEKVIKFDNQNLDIYYDVRAKYLEEKVGNIIKSKFINGKTFFNSQWQDERHGENDCTLIYENFAIVIEDKGGTINKNTYKGLLNAAKRDNQKLIEEPSKQANGFVELLRKNLGKILTLKTKGGPDNNLDLTNVDTVLAIGIVLSESPLQNISFSNIRKIPILSIYQFQVLFNCLTEYEIIDYFIKRHLIEKNTRYLADEYDFIYTYLKNGLNTSDKIYQKFEDKELLLVPYKEDDEISYHDKERDEWYQFIIDEVYNQHDEFWLHKEISLLAVPPIVQKQLKREAIKNKRVELLDNIVERKKVIIAEIIEFVDSDTDLEIETKLYQYYNYNKNNVCELLYIGFTIDNNYIVVKLLKNEKGIAC